MSQDLGHVDEQTRLLPHGAFQRQLGPHEPDEHVQSASSSSDANRGNQDLFSMGPQDMLPYNDFVTVDLLHDLVQSK